MTDAAADAPATLDPIAPEARIDALDVVRGFALFGIFLMNVEFFSRPLQDISGPGIDPAFHGADYWADAAIYFLVQSKFWTLFSLLFGMGFAVMIDRARRAGRPFVPAYLRRSLALLAIGIAHATLVWSGDILVSYAIAALLLLAVRGLFRAIRASAFEGETMPPLGAGWLAGLGLAAYALPMCLALVGGLSGTLMPGSQEGMAEAAAEEAKVGVAAGLVYAHGTYAEVVGQRVADTLDQFAELPSFLPFVLGMFLLGMATLRSGILERPVGWELRAMRNWGLPVGFAIMVVSLLCGTRMDFHQFTLREALQVDTYLLAGLVLAFAYAATLVIALEGRLGPMLRDWLAPAGRMALTNYLLQSVLGTLVFYGYGLGLWGQVGRAAQVGFVIVVFAAQMGLSRWWLANFRFGPAEWVWRTLTYGKAPAFRRAALA